MVSHNPVLLLLLEHIYAFCVLTSSTTAINSNLHSLGSYYVPGTMLNSLNVLFKPHNNCMTYPFSYFIDQEPEA